MAVTYSFSSGNTITAAEVNTNFTDALNETVSLTTSNLSTSAGIISTQLTDRYALVTETVMCTGWAYEANSVSQIFRGYAPDVTASPGTEFFRKYITCKSGRANYLCGISVHAKDITVGTGTSYPRLWFTRNGTLLGGSAVDLQADDTAYHLRNSNPIDNPLTSLAHNDYITIGVGVSVSATDTRLNRLSVTFTYKMELVP